ncbi:MAG: urease accessory protein UreD [Fibrobacterota bacterium]|nr:urease accessory protein UreD [Fibrobacterota bacterium]
MIQPILEWNAIEVARDGETSRLTRCLGYPPIKWINPRAQEGCCQVYISNYGGGLVDGDSVRMKVDCLPGSRLYLGTQSSTKVYKGQGKGGCSQETIGTLHANAMVVVGPDPVVPFADSRYRQAQSWEVHPEADLVLFDWLQPGRAARGEVFAYEIVRSEIRVTRPGGAPLISERFATEPGSQDPFRCGHFGDFQSFLSVYLVGPRALRLAESLEERILGLNKAGQNIRTASVSTRTASVSTRTASDAGGATSGASAIWVGTAKRDGEGFVIRAMGGGRRDLQPLHDMIFAALADAAWLGFNPWHRRW